MSVTNADSAEVLDHQRERAVVLLATGMSLRESALSLDVSYTTVWRWTKEPLFAERLEIMRGAITDSGTRQLRTLVPDAIGVLMEVMNNPDARDGDRLTAAAHVLDRAGIIKGQALTVRAEQLDDLEVLGELAEAAGVDDIAQGDQEEPA